MVADDGHSYVVKFRENPQHPRILINELISYALLEYLELPVPASRIVRVSERLIDAIPDFAMDENCRSCRPTPGLHFGSRHPDGRNRQSQRVVYDYLPSSLLWGVRNVAAFRGMAAFDKWVSNADGRQAIFYREQVNQHSECTAYTVQMIDHGFAFNAHAWNFADSPERGLYNRRQVYDGVSGYDSFEPWLSKICDVPTGVIEQASQKVPTEWLDPAGNDNDALDNLLNILYARRTRVPDLLKDARRSNRDPFPNWKADQETGAVFGA